MRRDGAACVVEDSLIGAPSPHPPSCARPVVRLVGRVAAPAVEGVVEQHPGLELREVVAYMRDRPSEAASRPGASGARSSRAVSAPRTIVASRSSGSVARPNSSTMTSKVQSSPRWLQNTSSPSMSKGVAPKRSATAGDLGGRDEQEDGGRVDEAADQPGAGDAVDLRPRARDPDGAALRRRAAAACAIGHQRQAGRRPGLEAALEHLGRHAVVPQPGGDALAELQRRFWQIDDGRAAGELAAPRLAASDRAAADRARGSGADRRRSPRRSGHR